MPSHIHRNILDKLVRLHGAETGGFRNQVRRSLNQKSAKLLDEDDMLWGVEPSAYVIDQKNHEIKAFEIIADQKLSDRQMMVYEETCWWLSQTHTGWTFSLVVVDEYSRMQQMFP